MQGLDSFPPVSEAERRSDTIGRGYFDILAEVPQAIHLVARWKRIKPLEAVATMTNPVTGRLPDGTLRAMLALSPPEASPLYGSVMTIEVQARSRLSPNANAPFLLLFTGGFAPSLANPELESSALAMLYPASDTAGLPSFDFVGR